MHWGYYAHSAVYIRLYDILTNFPLYEVFLQMLLMPNSFDKALLSRHVFFKLLSAILIGSMIGAFGFFYFCSSMQAFALVTKAGVLHTFILSALPLLLTAVAIWCSALWLPALLLFLKASAFSFCICWVCESYPGSAWLFRFLILFVDFFTLPILACFILYCFGQPCRKPLIFWIFCVLLTFGVVLLNRYYILPLLVAIEIL